MHHVIGFIMRHNHMDPYGPMDGLWIPIIIALWIPMDPNTKPEVR